MAYKSARQQKVIKGPLSEEQMEIASENNARMLNSTQTHVKYCII